MDPAIEAARRFIVEGAATLRRASADADADLLNRRPAGAETNSIAVLATHAMSATRLWVTVAVAADRPDRHRASEFEAEAEDAASLIDIIDDLEADALAALDAAGPVDWSSGRTFSRDDGSSFEVSAAFALIHAVEHLQGHAAEASLTRHVLG